MKYTIISLAVLLAIFTSCARTSDKLEGRWQIIYITPSDNIKSDGEQTAFTWLNILSDQSSLAFRNDSIFVNNDFKSKYKLENNSLYYQKDNAFQKVYDYSFNNDTLILKNISENVTIKMKKKSP
jgi:hypothetical protein